MPELFLYSTDIPTQFQQAGGEGMPQRVTSYLFLEADTFRVTAR